MRSHQLEQPQQQVLAHGGQKSNPNLRISGTFWCTGLWGNAEEPGTLSRSRDEHPTPSLWDLGPGHSRALHSRSQMVRDAMD